MPTLSQVFGCSPPIDCPGTDNPVLNLSSEAPDQAILIGLNWGPPFIPPANNGFISDGCITECDSLISQQDADLCAARQSLLCVFDKHNNPNPLPGPSILCNTTQTATVFCPDGLPFTYTVPAGLFCGDSLTLVNQRAQAYAAQLAQQLKICLDNPQQCTCINQSYSSQVNIVGATSSGVTWSIDNGTLPPGLALSQTGAISGTPTLAGTYNFTVLAITGLGTFMQKPFQIVVLQIATTSLPPFSIGGTYSAQLQAIGGSGNYSWKVSSGSLPAGLSVSLSGLVSGTPTGAGVNPVVFSVIDTKCENADQSFFPPSVTLSTKSTTQIATVLGWNEFPGFISSPPKKFKTISYSGSSEQQLWYQGLQIGGARFDFSGTDQIDEFGNVINTHTKELSVMCDGAKNRAAIIGGISSVNPNYSNAASFLGYFGTNNVFLSPPCLINPTELCGVPSNPYVSKGNVASRPAFGLPQQDLNGLWGSGFFGSTEELNFIGSAIVQANSNVLASSNDVGVSNVSISPYAIPLLTPTGNLVIFETGLYLEAFSQLETPCGIVPRPPDWNAAAQVIFTNNFSATLQNEYTDAEALAKAHVINGNSAVAQNNPRTTGFISSFTTVTYTLSATNLINGTNYTVSVDLADLTAGTIQTVQIGFTGDTTGKHTVTTQIPQPPAGHFVQVRNPRITFA